ncbi:MAG: hypothetical protein U1E83_01830 [Methylotetracoccus sp.]
MIGAMMSAGLVATAVSQPAFAHEQRILADGDHGWLVAVGYHYELPFEDQFNRVDLFAMRCEDPQCKGKVVPADDVTGTVTLQYLESDDWKAPILAQKTLKGPLLKNMDVKPLNLWNIDFLPNVDGAYAIQVDITVKKGDEAYHLAGDDGRFVCGRGFLGLGDEVQCIADVPSFPLPSSNNHRNNRPGDVRSEH